VQPVRHVLASVIKLGDTGSAVLSVNLVRWCISNKKTVAIVDTKTNETTGKAFFHQESSHTTLDALQLVIALNDANNPALTSTILLILINDDSGHYTLYTSWLDVCSMSAWVILSSWQRPVRMNHIRMKSKPLTFTMTRTITAFTKKMISAVTCFLAGRPAFVYAPTERTMPKVNYVRGRGRGHKGWGISPTEWRTPIQIVHQMLALSTNIHWQHRNTL